MNTDATPTATPTDDAGHTEPDYDRPNIFVCGPSGSGKSTSLRNLDPATTIVINTERKALPFRRARRFTRQARVSTLAEFNRAFERAISAANVEAVVVDSWTSIVEFAYAETVAKAERDNKENNTQDAWGRYKELLHAILLRSKSVSDRFVIFTGVDVTTQDNTGRLLSCIDVQGSLKGKVEKEFTIVLQSVVIEANALTDEPKQYRFMTNSDGLTRSKSPMGMFEEFIDNDLALVMRQAAAFYLDDDEDDEDDEDVAPAAEDTLASFEADTPAPASSAA